MFKKVLKHAFTIVELVVVIAVIAALAAVLIPTFANVMTAANESADEQAVRNMNMALYAEEKTSGTPINPSDAMAIIEEAGYTVKDYVAQLSANTIYWDSTMNRCLIYNSEKEAVTYPDDAVSKYADTAYTSANIPTFWYTLSDAYVTKVYDSTTSTTTFAETVASLSAGETLQLQNDVTLKYSEYVASDVSSITLASQTYSNISKLSPLTLLSGEEVTIDLNGNSLTTSYGMIYNGTSATRTTFVANNSSLYIKNGTIVDGSGATSSGGVFIVEKGSSITLDNVEISSKGTVLYPAGDAAQVNILNSNIYTTGAYAISTNASTAYSCIINVENSTIQTKEYATTILINTNVTLNISNSTIISGNYGESDNSHDGLGAQTILCRSGSVNISDSTITLYTNFTNTHGSSDGTATGAGALNNYYVSWTTGNAAPFTAIVLGDASTTANYHTTNAVLSMTGCTVNVLDTATGKALESGRAIYMYGKDETGYKSELTFDSSTKINGYVVVGGSQDVTLTSYPAYYECSVVTINGTSYSPTIGVDTNSKTGDYMTYGILYTVSGTTLTKVS